MVKRVLHIDLDIFLKDPLCRQASLQTLTYSRSNKLYPKFDHKTKYL